MRASEKRANVKFATSAPFPNTWGRGGQSRTPRWRQLLIAAPRHSGGAERQTLGVAACAAAVI